MTPQEAATRGISLLEAHNHSDGEAEYRAYNSHAYNYFGPVASHYLACQREIERLKRKLVHLQECCEYYAQHTSVVYGLLKPSKYSERARVAMALAASEDKED